MNLLVETMILANKIIGLVMSMDKWLGDIINLDTNSYESKCCIQLMDQSTCGWSLTTIWYNLFPLNK